ncbi:MAG: prolyl oligopeptidase family serine peptidase [Prevotellaceae bacterium]|jgi:dipeptidyl aminopeptidase/acylaminoacyl peptidase|nr:prolyl oligopeptidase family serine peptidase [Prevotellaceae bacterium]
MKKIIFFLMTATVALSACSGQPDGQTAGRNELTIADGILTADILNSFGRVSDLQLSPDGKTALYGVSYPNIADNKSVRELFTVGTDGSNRQRITFSSKSKSNARWIAGGAKIAYLSDGQLWVMNADGSRPQQVSRYDGGIAEFAFSPDGTQVLFIASINSDDIRHPSDFYDDLPKANARVVTDLMYRHWDEWVEDTPHPFVAAFDGTGLSEIVDLLDGEPFECPTRPFGGIEQLSWSPDGKTIAYACRKKTGREYAFSTNTDIYLLDVATRTTTNMTPGMNGYDSDPQFSPDGRYLAWNSMEREGYEADKIRLFILELATGEKTHLTEAFDNNVGVFTWAPDSRSIYFQASVEGASRIYALTVEGKTLRTIAEGPYNYGAPQVADDKIIALRQSISQPDEVYAIDRATGEVAELSFENKHLLDQLTMGRVEERMIKTTDGRDMFTFVIYPPRFDPSKKYPTLLFCEGGPQSPLDQFWSYRWNFQLMAAHDYIIVAPARRGVTGFGQAWCEQISGDYSGQNMQDYFSAIDALKAEPYVDEDRLGAVGASYGGYSVYYLAGCHNKRFKAFIAHSGIFNLEQMALTTEEQWFVNWDNGGYYWETNNSTAQRSYAHSPHRFVDKWDTPIMVMHGERDFRVPFEQGMAAFNAARIRNIPAKMVLFPEENHWILKPQNNIFWHRTFYAWLDEQLKMGN